MTNIKAIVKKTGQNKQIIILTSAVSVEETYQVLRNLYLS